MVAPVIEGLADQYQGQVKVAKLNTEDHPTTAMRFRVMSIPTVMLFKDGQPVEVVVGADMSGRQYRARIEKHLGAGTAAADATAPTHRRELRPRSLSPAPSTEGVGLVGPQATRSPST
jgi:thioredoxin-like negative regulator of GroEL